MSPAPQGALRIQVSYKPVLAEMVMDSWETYQGRSSLDAEDSIRVVMSFNGTGKHRLAATATVRSALENEKAGLAEIEQALFRLG